MSSRPTILIGACLVAFGGLPACDADSIRTEQVSHARTPQVRIKDIRSGRGPAAANGSRVEVHYVGRLKNGTVLMSTRQRGRPHSWTVGDGTVIRGMDDAVRGMRTGGTREVRIPPELHWGRPGHGGVVPENEFVYFDIEMVRVIAQ